MKAEKSLALVARRIALKKNNTNEHCQSSIAKGADARQLGTLNRGKNIFISAQGILTLNSRPTVVFITTTGISGLVVLLQIFTYFTLMSKCGLVE